MKIFFVSFFLMSCTLFLSAQERPSFLSEDANAKSMILEEFSRPGILNKSRSRGLEISMLTVGRSEQFDEDDRSVSEGKIKSIQQYVFKVKVPVVNKEDLRVLLGYSFRPEQYQYSSFGENHAAVFQHLDGQLLKSQQASLFINKSLNEKRYLTIMGRMAFNGDYDNFFNLDRQYQLFTVTALYGVKKSENTELGFGLLFSHSFRRTIALPVFMYHHNFNDKFGVELALPAAAFGRLNINKSTLLLFGAEYNSRSYAIEVPNDNDKPTSYGMNHSEIRFPIRLEKQIHSWVWLGAQVGYQYNFSTDFDTDEGASFKVEAKSAPYFKLGLFLSPPNRNR